jgi:hypothetical protein
MWDRLQLAEQVNNLAVFSTAKYRAKQRRVAKLILISDIRASMQ